MEDKNYSAVPPPPSLTDNGSTVNFSDALSRARAIAEKLKQTPTPGPAASPVEPPAAGIKRGHEDSSSSSFSSPNDRENKRGAYDVGASRPAYTSSEPRRYGLGSEERRGTSTYGAASGRQEEYSVPNHMVGLLIGKGGENLKKIERVSGVSKVQFAAARDMIRQMVDDAKANEANRTTGPPGGGYHYQGNMHSNSIQVRIPVPKIGLVIGRGGETIREFEQQSRAKIILPSDSAGDINNERAVTLIGDEAAVQHAKQLIEDIVFGSPNLATPRYSQYGASHGMGVGGGPNDQRIYVPIPATVVGLIIGRGGETIRYFQEQSGARVKVDLSGDPNAEERNVCITGEPQALAVAKRLVEEKVAEFQQYDYSQYYAQYGYDQYQAYAQYNYGGYQPGTATPAPAPGTTPESTPAVANTPASTTETDNNSDQKSTAEAAAAYYAHYYGQPQTQEQKDAYNQWFQQYYGQYYNQQSDSQERANPSLTEADQEETKADEKTDKNSQSEEDDKKDDSQSENQDENENENEEEAGDSE
ncbi:hypothetical protein BY458DRAFT_536884 [Sporodiniella umbellata]|nr:hypothetical protein BY458DRAFT_536884 [Sporodiniella umbellata]